jgi:hypothetical protein
VARGRGRIGIVLTFYGIRIATDVAFPACRRVVDPYDARQDRLGLQMKILVSRMVANIAARGRSLGNRFAWWSRWFPPAPTVDANRFQGDRDPYPDHWKEFPRPWSAGQDVESEALRATLAALPDR